MVSNLLLIRAVLHGITPYIRHFAYISMSVGCISRNGIAGSYGSCIFFFFWQILPNCRRLYTNYIPTSRDGEWHVLLNPRPGLCHWRVYFSEVGQSPQPLGLTCATIGVFLSVVRTHFPTLRDTTFFSKHSRAFPIVSIGNRLISICVSS